jgi:hypothetical protein
MQAAGGTKYLVVDDHSRTRHAMIEALGQPGDTFHEAGSGEEEMMRQAHAAGARGFVSKDAIADLRSLLEQM